MKSETSEKELQIAKDIISKQTYELSVIRKGLERLRHDNSWQGVEEVNAFLDKLIAVQD
jgi:hypothetical protein